VVGESHFTTSSRTKLTPLSHVVLRGGAGASFITLSFYHFIIHPAKRDKF